MVIEYHRLRGGFGHGDVLVRQRAGRLGRGRGQRAERAVERGDGGRLVEIAIDLHFHRPLRQRGAPDLLEAIEGGGLGLLGRRGGEAGVLAALVERQVAVQHALRRSGEGGVLDARGGLGALERQLVPARQGQLAGEEIELIGKVSRARFGGELERGVIDVEIEAHLAPGRDAIEILAVKAGETRINQRDLAQRDIGRVRRGDGSGAAAEADLDHDPARLFDHRP